MNRGKRATTPELRRACASLFGAMNISEEEFASLTSKYSELSDPDDPQVRISTSDDEDEGSAVVSAVQATKQSAARATSSKESVTDAVNTPVARKSTRLKLKHEESVKCAQQATTSEEELHDQLVREQLRALGQHLTRLIIEKRAAEYELSQIKKAINENDRRIVVVMQQLQEFGQPQGKEYSEQEKGPEKHLAADSCCSVPEPLGDTDLEVSTDGEVDVDVIICE